MLALEYGEAKPEQITEWRLSDEDFDKLYKLGVFEAINNQCEVIIDDFESEWIEGDGLKEAIKALEEVYGAENLKALKRLKELIVLAIENNTCIDFDF